GVRPVIAVGVALSAQEAQDLPADDYDERLDWAVTEREARRFSRSPERSRCDFCSWAMWWVEAGAMRWLQNSRRCVASWRLILWWSMGRTPLASSGLRRRSATIFWMRVAISSRLSIFHGISLKLLFIASGKRGWFVRLI